MKVQNWWRRIFYVGVGETPFCFVVIIFELFYNVVVEIYKLQNT
jgi:hypothetical protein